ncbi:MAG: hypothetical protein K2Y22_07160 [Candidatus Obscuribacterales bacterium]|nr:hypothetical protein [Candidatus Obscuribacterales bacterium]
MTPASNSSIQTTVRQLKEIISNLRGQEHEAYLLVSQMENLVSEIERKAKRSGQTLAASPTSNSKITS